MVETTTSLLMYRDGSPSQQFQHGILHFVQALAARSCTGTGCAC